MSAPTTSAEFYMVAALRDPRRPWLGLTIPAIRKGKPTVRPGEIALRLELRLPISLFEEFIPSGVIEIPADAAVGRAAVQVEVPDAVRLVPGVRLKLVPVEEDPK